MVARELLDLEAAAAIAQAIDKVIPKSDAGTDTQELDKAREYAESVTADRIVSLLQRAKSAELKVTCLHRGHPGKGACFVLYTV